MNFKKGDLIRCIHSTNEGYYKHGVPFGIKRNVIYEVEGLDKCEFCGAELVLLKGVNSGSRKECVCSDHPIFPTNAFLSIRFEKAIKETVKKEAEEFLSEGVYCS